MEKYSREMDIEEWELLPIPNDSHTLFEFGLESGKDLLFSKETNFGPMAVVDSHYFILPSQPSKAQDVVKDSTSAKDGKEEDSFVEFKDIGVVPSPQVIIDHRNFTSQHIFKKLKDDEFVDMNLESPKFSTRGKIVPFIAPEAVLTGDEVEEGLYEDEKYAVIEKEGMDEEEESVNRDAKAKPCWEGVGLKVWRWKLMGGVGALCSIGLAAATICIFVLGSHQQPKHEPHSQRLQFQTYADEKRIKQVMQQATRLNNALTAVRGVPMTRANISFGGYYDGL